MKKTFFLLCGTLGLFYYASGQLYPEGSFSTGSFPREVSPSPDGSVVAITNFNSNTVQIN